MGNNMLMTMGALAILGCFVLSANRMMLTNTQVPMQTEHYLTALSIAQSIIDEAKTKAFDQNVVSTSVSDTSGLSLTLGRESGESVPVPDTLVTSSGYWSATKFNDVDDYNGYTRRINTPRMTGYFATVSVTYASLTYPDSSTTKRTFCKRMTVWVSIPIWSDSLSINYSFTY
jgi:hypothetical protein